MTVGSRSLNYSDCNRVGGRGRRHQGRLDMAIEEGIRICAEREREKCTRSFQSKVLEARGVSALEVALVGVCARVM